MFRSYFRSKTFVVLTCLAVLSMSPVINVASWVWSETFFVLLAVIFVIGITGLLNQYSNKRLIILSIICMLALLQRYVGITLLLTGVLSILLFLKNITFGERLKKSAIFGLISFVPVGIWIIRNFVLTGTVAGFRGPSPYSLYDNLYFSSNVITSWFLPVNLSLSSRLAIVAGFLMLCIVAAILLRGKANLRINTQSLKKLYPSITFVTVYLVFIIVTSSITGMNKITNRYLVPVSIFIIFFVFAVMEDLYMRLHSWAKRKLIAVIFTVVFFSIWFSYSMSTFYVKVEEKMEKGAGDYNTDICRESALIKLVREFPEKAYVISNLPPEAIYYLAGKSSTKIPKRYDVLTKQKNRHYEIQIERLKKEFKKKNGIFVWFDPILRWDLPKEQELIREMNLKLSKRVFDGRIYRSE
jgi:hypothetical protein